MPGAKCQGILDDGRLTDAQGRTVDFRNKLRRQFRPELLNRVDDVVLFKRLTLPQIERIVDLQFDQLRQRLAERRMTLELTEAGRRLTAGHLPEPAR